MTNDEIHSQYIGTYYEGRHVILVTKDMDRWHLSISHPNRYPHWDDIKYARYKYLPNDIYVAMILPPPGNYVNLHRNCFHLWQIDDALNENISEL